MRALSNLSNKPFAGPNGPKIKPFITGRARPKKFRFLPSLDRVMSTGSECGRGSGTHFSWHVPAFEGRKKTQFIEASVSNEPRSLNSKHASTHSQSHKFRKSKHLRGKL